MRWTDCLLVVFTGILSNSLVAADAFCGNYFSVTCYGDNAYCCYSGGTTCCYHYYVYEYWWFWSIWVFVICMIAACLGCLRRRRRLAAARYVRMGQPEYGSTTVVTASVPSYPTGTQPYPQQTPQGYPPQGYPQQGPQGYPQQGPQGYPTAPPSYAAATPSEGPLQKTAPPPPYQ